MVRTIQGVLKPSGTGSLARTFARLGRVGFWMQIAIGSIPVALVLYALVFGRDSGGGTRAGLVLVQYLTMMSLLVLLFTTVWFYRYTRLAKRIADADRRPSESSVLGAVWVGIAASTLGIVLSLLIMLLEASQLLLYFLRAPQAGVPVVQTTAGPASWVSAGDILGLLALIVTLSVEIAVLGMGLWLLFRSMVEFADYPLVASEEQA
ncbi:sterol desaturase/sphingolipid hydroxylase (fatty acid hydroxylase superfamily) [Bradyrhizobium sp. AZCC 1678]|uniref:DUF3611 family protein n=1 Tax=Bradyrhizobium sp. AZCC 1678 TaxID=3117030 RepID=UPI002FF02EE6